MRSVPPLSPNTPAIAADIITPSEFLRLKQGSENAKKLETKANEEPKEDDSKNDTKKPNDAPPPPQQQEVAKAEPPPEPEPPKAAEPEKPDVDPIAKKIEESPPPAPTPSPSAEDKKKLEQKLEEQRKAEEAKAKAEEQAKQKAEEEAKQKAAEEAKKKAEEEAKKKAEAKKKKEEAERKKKRAEALKKKKREEARKKAEAAKKKKFDPSRIASILAKESDDASPKALIDKDPRKKGQQASGTSKTAEDIGQEAGTATGTDTVLSLREQDMLKGMLKSQLNGCWRPPGTGGGSDVPVVSLHWELNPDGSLVGQPRVTSAPSTTAGQVYAEAALRAVRMCAPFRLPPDKYAAWKIIEWTFDPREML